MQLIHKERENLGCCSKLSLTSPTVCLCVYSMCIYVSFGCLLVQVSVCACVCVCVFSGETKFPVTLNNYSKSFKLKSFPQRHFLSFFVPESQQMNQFLSQQRHFQHFRTTTQKGSAIFLLFDLCKNCFVFFFHWRGQFSGNCVLPVRSGHCQSCQGHRRFTLHLN